MIKRINVHIQYCEIRIQNQTFEVLFKFTNQLRTVRYKIEKVEKIPEKYE